MDKKLIGRSTPLIYSTCPKYRSLAAGFFYFWKKYFPHYIGPVFVTDSSSISDKINNYLWQLPEKYENLSFSTRLIRTLRHIKSEFVLFTLDDFWLSAPIDEKLLDEAIKVMIGNKKIAYFNLAECKFGNRHPDSTLATRMPRKAEYRVSTQMGIWRTKALLKLLRRGESAWLFETYGTKRSRLSNWIYLCLSENATPCFRYNYGGVIWRGSFNAAGLKQSRQNGLEGIANSFPQNAKIVFHKRSFIYRAFRWSYQHVYCWLSAVLPVPYLLKG